MKIAFIQAYLKPGVRFPFSHVFQRFLACEVSSRVRPSPNFCQSFGADYTVVLYISAKSGTNETAIAGPTVFPAKKDVEYTLFLPYDVVMADADPLGRTLKLLFVAIREVLRRLEIDTIALQEDEGKLSEAIRADPEMIRGTQNWV